MKKNYLIILLIIATITISGQMKDPDRRSERPFEKIEQLEKAKLIEVLDLNEEMAIKFFARRNEHQKNMRELMNNRESLLNDLEKNIKEKGLKDSYYSEQVNKILEHEKLMSLGKQEFIKSLSDILNPQQIAKLTVFEFKFRREIAKSLMGRKRPKDGQ
ncbi:MAG: hypothetical protein RDU14_01120 [Melioribacteraceae bacterium]|nr:hypothetical protein [Melioribacteraceae bacterium]